MTEKQDIAVSRALNTSSWVFVGFEENNNEESATFKVYQTNKGVLFAINLLTGKIHYEVYETDDNIFQIY